jgi:threonine aldolase
VQFCLSKGLSAPIGSILAGSAEFIARARRIRKMLGGGMRQAGIIAAAGMVALNEMVDRLAEDHAHAQTLAAGLATIPGIAINPADVHTDIVVFSLTDGRSAGEFVAAMKQHGILVGGFGPTSIRAVTHYGIDGNHIEHTLESVRTVMSQTSSTPSTNSGPYGR